MKYIYKFIFGLFLISVLHLGQFGLAASDDNKENVLDTSVLEDKKVDYSYLKKELRVAVMARKLGIDWEKEAVFCAQLAGIREKYRGTKDQNVKIREFLVSNLDRVDELKYDIATVMNQQNGDSGDVMLVHKEGSQVEERGQNINTEENVLDKDSGQNNTGSNIDVKAADDVAGLYNDDLLSAYQWAYGVGITSIDDINEAGFGKGLTRAELAKMMSVFAVEVYGRPEIVHEDALYGDVDASLGDLQGYIQKAYRLQIMGINSDGTPLVNFMPNQLATRAEFATVSSRVLFGGAYNQNGDIWFRRHLAILRKGGVLVNRAPEEVELKENVVMLLYRIQDLGFLIDRVPQQKDEIVVNSGSSVDVGGLEDKEPYIGNVENIKTEKTSDVKGSGSDSVYEKNDDKKDVSVVSGDVVDVNEAEKTEISGEDSNVVEDVKNDDNGAVVVTGEVAKNDDPNKLIKINFDGVLKHHGFSDGDYKQKLVQYAYKLGGLDFVYTLECENGNWDIGAVGDHGHAFGLCQMNDRYHRDIPSDYKSNGIVQIEYCYKKWVSGTKFYGPGRIVKGQTCRKYVQNRFVLI